MCEKCNETLLAASQAALNLANAAKSLESINRSAEATTLAKAAADLFAEVPESSGTAGEESAQAPEPTIPQRGFYTDAKTGELYLNGERIGRVVALRRS